jgi:hypothetical protein
MDFVMDDDYCDDVESDHANFRFERLEAGRYAVSASLMIGDKVETRRIECSNAAWGTAQLEEELSELLLAHERAKALPRLLPPTDTELKASDKRARRKTRTSNSSGS